MKRSVLTLSLALVLGAAGALRAEECPPTVAGLRHCVQHAFEAGHIDNAGIAASLLAKVDAAQAGLDRGQPEVAVAVLEAFVNEVLALGGIQIESPHDQHMVEHAEAVIAALSD